jgi:hypothetical protein
MHVWGCTPVRTATFGGTTTHHRIPNTVQLANLSFGWVATKDKPRFLGVMEGILRGPSTSEHRSTSVPAPAKVSAMLHLGFSHHCSVLRPVFRTLHSLLRYQSPSACFRPVCQSSTCLSITFLAGQSNCQRFFSPLHPSSFVDSLGSELVRWMQSCCFGLEQDLRRWAFFSAAFHPPVARSKCDQQPDGRSRPQPEALKHPQGRYRDSRHSCPAHEEDSSKRCTPVRDARLRRRMPVRDTRL